MATPLMQLDSTAALRAGAPTSHTYTYLFCDLRTDTLLAELPLTDVSYSFELNGIGTLRGTIPYNAETLRLDPETASMPGRTAVYVDRDGVLIWGGIIWTRQQKGESGKEIQASEFLSYFQRRYIKKTLSSNLDLIDDDRYVNLGGQRIWQDQKFLVWALMWYAQAEPGGSIGIDINPLTGDEHGVNRYGTTYYGYERPEIYKAIADLAAADNGFDFGVEISYSPAANGQAPRRRRRMQAWYPRRGRTAAQSGLVFSKGGTAGSILSYDWPEDGASLVTEMTGLGAGEGKARIVRTARATDLINSGWPLLEGVATYDDVMDQEQVQGMTNADLQNLSQSTVQPTFVVAADADPQFGSYEVGDEALFVIDPEPLSPNGRQGVLRIVSIENTAIDGPERVRLTCVGV